MVEAWQDDPNGKRGKWTDVCRFKTEDIELTPCLNNIVTVVLEAMDAGVHIACLQESGRPVERTLQSALLGHFKVESSAIAAQAHIINTVVYDSRALELLHAEPVQWPHYSIVQFACFWHRAQGRVVAVLNAHREHPFETSEGIGRELLAIMRAVEHQRDRSLQLDASTMWVVCGDFNRPLEDPCGTMRVANPGTLLTCCRNDATSVQSQDFIAHGAYDNILVLDRFGERFLEVDSPAGGNYGSMIRRHTERLIALSSDHMPVAARITSDFQHALTTGRARERPEDQPPWKQPRV